MKPGASSHSHTKGYYSPPSFMERQKANTSTYWVEAPITHDSQQRFSVKKIIKSERNTNYALKNSIKGRSLAIKVPDVINVWHYKHTKILFYMYQTGKE